MKGDNAPECLRMTLTQILFFYIEEMTGLIFDFGAITPIRTNVANIMKFFLYGPHPIHSFYNPGIMDHYGWGFSGTVKLSEYPSLILLKNC